MAERAKLGVSVGLGWQRSPVVQPEAAAFALPFWVNDTVDADFKYFPIAYNGATNETVAEAQARMVRDCTVTSWTMRVSSALAAGETLTFRFVINGTPDATLTVSLGEGDIDAVSADGALDFAEGDLVAVEGVLGGTLTSKIVRGGVIAFEVEGGAPFFVSVADTSNGIRDVSFHGYYPIVGGNSYTDIDNVPAANFNPFTSALTFTKLAAQLTSATVGDFDLLTRVGVVLGSGLTIPDGQTGIVGNDIDIELTRPADKTELEDTQGVIVVNEAQTIDLRVVSAYSVDAPLDAWSFIAGGFSGTSNMGVSAPNATFWQAFGTTDARIVESQVVLRWPNLPGTFKYFLAVGVTRFPTNSPVYSPHLRINGSTFLAVSSGPVTAAPFLCLDSTTEVAVAAGDLVCFSTTADGPFDQDNGTRMLYAIGFLPD